MLNKLLFIFNIISIQICYDTVGLAMLARHGHRYSFHERIQQSKRGQLSTLGQRMNYLLGKYVKQNYSKFLDKRFDANKFWFQASGQPRTINSAQSFITGLYGFDSFNEEFKQDQEIYTQPQWKGFDIEDDVKTPLPYGYQGFPLKSWLKKDNYQLESWSSQCPKLQQFELSNYDQTKVLIQNFENLVPELENADVDVKDLIGDKEIDSQLIYDVLEFIISQYYLGEYQKLNDVLINKISIILAQFYISKLFNDSNMNKYHNTYVLNNIKNLFNNIINNIQDDVRSSYQNFYFVDYHDSNFLSLLYLLGYTNFDCLQDQLEGKENDECLALPSYASSMIFELNYDKENFYVKLKKDGQELKLCKEEKEIGCDIKSVLNLFKDITLEGKQRELDLKYCFVLKKPKSQTHLFFKFLLVLNLVLICIVGFMIFYVQKDINQKI